MADVASNLRRNTKTKAFLHWSGSWLSKDLFTIAKRELKVKSNVSCFLKDIVTLIFVTSEE